jgi:hypothetical protein
MTIIAMMTLTVARRIISSDITMIKSMVSNGSNGNDDSTGSSIKLSIWPDFPLAVFKYILYNCVSPKT